ncbi:glucose 1-dehydrogenase [Gordonia sp. KTR9]|uniref:SDR family NAD(P)-dependent oxidoreductase n=1 Tax=Gordonia sp. KTR9 TaxID=337191 RepID=UPI0005C8C62C
MKLFNGKVAVVTGAGSGIGEATAKKLAAEGASVVVADVSDRGGERVVEEIAAAGGLATFVRVDISNEVDVDRMITSAVESYGRLDMAVNNAGISHPPVRMHQVESTSFDAVLNVNLKGTWLCMRAEIAYFLDNGGGNIVNTTSITGLKAGPLQSVYSATKHAIVGLTRNAAVEYVKDDIRVNAVAPGPVWTPLMRAQPAEITDHYSARAPSGRMAETEEIADVIAWLLSDGSRHISGETVTIDLAGMQA